jgi:sorting nexin-9/18/33
MPAAGPAFYARVYHPAFNLDIEDAEDTLHCFQTHTKAVGKGIQRLRTVFGRVRESRIGSFFFLHLFFIIQELIPCLSSEMSKAERLLSYSLLSLITSKPLTSTISPINEEDEHPNSNHNGKAKGLVNSYGAWCWREGCVG